MTYIPNVRERETTMFGKTRENAYWEGNLDTAGKRDLMMYDAAIEDMESWFGSLGYSNVVHMRREELKALRDDFCQWCESERNEMVVAMLDDQACSEEADDGD